MTAQIIVAVIASVMSIVGIYIVVKIITESYREYKRAPRWWKMELEFIWIDVACILTGLIVASIFIAGMIMVGGKL